MMKNTAPPARLSGRTESIGPIFAGFMTLALVLSTPIQVLAPNVLGLLSQT